MRSAFLINYSTLLLVAFGTQCSRSVERKPSIAVAVSRKGLQFFSSIGHKIVTHELPKIVIPSISLPIDGGPGEGEVFVKQLKIKKFESPVFQFHLSPPDAINWKSDGGGIKLSGHWNATYTWLTTFYLKGWVEVTVSEIRSNVTITAFGKDGHPQLQVDSCGVDILNLYLSLGGGVIQWIINLFKSDLSYAVKNAINQQLCNALETVILDQANDALRTIPKHVYISSMVYLDYELEAKPIQVTNTHVIGQSYIDVMLGNQTCQIPTRPLQIGKIDDNFMSNIWITETVPNCLLESAHKSKYLHFVLDKSVYAKLDTFLSTNCSWYEICMGKFFPELAKQYPNRHIQMNFYSAKAPSIVLSSQKANVVSDFFADWQIQPEEGKVDINETLARIDMKLTATVEPVLYNQRLCGKINSTQINFSEIYSKIGEISQSFLDTMNLVLNPVIRVAADTTLQLGIPIPLVENVSITNQTELTVEDGAVRCNADFLYVNSTDLFN
ncbi:LBP / BPI / CETP family protein [Aphelenchoides bicaudatus]|nr:LBP / BPI / CETP family protein [Aphelenchoides bicaudatus]